MPELGEVEVVRRNLVRWWEGRSASAVRILDEKLVDETAPETLRAAMSKPVDEVGRRGKYLLGRFDDGETVVFHFRMTGKIIRCDDPKPDYARMVWRVDDVGWLVFKDQRRLGEVWLLEAGDLRDFEPLARMGPEPGEATVEDLRDGCTGRRMLKTALLDQSIVAGVGNIAVSELLWRLELAPDVRCGELTDEQWRELVDEMPRYFDEVVEASMSDEVRYFGEAGEPVDPFRIYGKDGHECPRCGDTLEKSRVGGRSSYYCPGCQKAEGRGQKAEDG